MLSLTALTEKSAKMIKRYVVTGSMIVLILIGSVALGRRVHGNISTAQLHGNKFKGPNHAPVRMVVYSDFQCPACSYGAKAEDDFMKIFPDMISVEFRHFPLEMHRWALEAALFAECAAEQGKFWEFHDRTFKEQAEWSKQERPTGTFWKYCADLGLKQEKLEKCVESDKTLRKIQKENDSGKALHVNATPSFFINDKRFVGGKQLETDGKKFAVEELKKAGIIINLPPEAFLPPPPPENSGNPQGQPAGQIPGAIPPGTPNTVTIPPPAVAQPTQPENASVSAKQAGENPPPGVAANQASGENVIQGVKP